MDTPLNSQYLKKYFTAGKIGLDYNYAVKRQIFFKPATVQIFSASALHNAEKNMVATTASRSSSIAAKQYFWNILGMIKQCSNIILVCSLSALPSLDSLIRVWWDTPKRERESGLSLNPTTLFDPTILKCGSVGPQTQSVVGSNGRERGAALPLFFGRMQKGMKLHILQLHTSWLKSSCLNKVPLICDQISAFF